MEEGRVPAGVSASVSTAGRRRIPVIVGPTAAGKTAAALALAAAFPEIEIISADSRQIYIGMEIGTAKPTREELAAAPHHMIDVVTPDVRYSAGMYADAVSALLRGIMERGKVPLLVGGTGFYLKALFQGLGAPTVDPAVLAELEARCRGIGASAMHQELAAIDLVAAAAHSPNNVVKTLRALACYYQTGRPYSSFLTSDASASEWEPCYLGIAPERGLLYGRIDARVLTMIEAGLIAETEGLLASGIAGDAPGMRTVGYAEVVEYLRGAIDRPRMIELIQQSTRNYAKRQMTWFRSVEGITWLEGPEPVSVRAWYERVSGG